MALERAVAAAGGQSAFADALSKRLAERGVESVSQPRVWNWLKRDKKAPPEFAPDIHALYGIPVEELAPEVDWSAVRAGGQAANEDALQRAEPRVQG